METTEFRRCTSSTCAILRASLCQTCGSSLSDGLDGAAHSTQCVIQVYCGAHHELFGKLLWERGLDGRHSGRGLRASSSKPLSDLAYLICRSRSASCANCWRHHHVATRKWSITARKAPGMGTAFSSTTYARFTAVAAGHGALPLRSPHRVR